MDKFERLNFGAPAAERDINQGLKEYFYESDSFQKIKRGEKSVILGNRGTGKSAIFKMLAEEYKKQHNLVVELSPEDYSYEMLSEILKKEYEGNWAKQGAYAAAWKYLIYVLAMKKQTENDPQYVKRESKQLFSYLRDRHKGQQYGKLDALISYLKRIEGIKVGKYEASIKAKSLQQLYKLEEISDLLPDLKRICDKNPIIFLIDELDRGWDASEDAQAFASGLFQAALSINQLTPNLRILISLRKELYDNIPSLYEDSQKVWDLFEVIEWDEETLLTMITKRIEHFYPELKGHNSQEKWNHIFSETLDYRQTKSFNYVVDRTLYRPREIIQFCTEIKNAAIQDQELPPLNYRTISSAEFVYSEKRTQDIAAEYRFQYPGLLSIFETFRGLSYNLERVDLEYHCLEIITGERKIDLEATNWTKGQESDFLITVLWQVGFLRAQAIGGLKAKRRSGSSYLGPHQIFNLNLSTITRFHVHPMFRAFLGLREAK